MQSIPGNTSWAGVPEAQRGVATSPRNARSSVAVVRQGLATPDPSGARGFEIDADTEVLRGTYNLVIPLLEARGRVDTLRIALHYQSRMWFGEYEANMAILDGDQRKAPGWSLGLPKLLGGILIEGDGTRRPARRTAVTALGQEDVDVSYITTDGSDITYRIQLSPSGTDPTSARGEVRYPDGSLIVVQGQAGTNLLGGTSVLFTRLYATTIIDPHGNVTTIEYDFSDIPFFPHSAPRAVRLIDPLGREVKFHYYYGFLTAITAPALGGKERVLARLTYKYTEAYYAIDASDPAKDHFCYVGLPSYFGDDLNDPNSWIGGPSVSGWRACDGDPNQKHWKISVVEGIFFPATGTGYWFGDADSYNQYGMLTKVVEQAQMAHTAPSLTDVGTLTPGTTIRTRTYDFPKGPPATGDRQAFPRYKTMTETFSGMSAPLVTRYEVSEQTGGSVVYATLPDGARRITILEAGTGLPRSREVNGVDGTLVSYDEYSWTVGADGVSRLTQLIETDPLGRKKRTEYTFNAQGRVQDVKVYDWVEPTQINSAPLLRWLRYEYGTDPVYAQRGIRGLVSRVEIYGSRSLLPEERTDYEYDGLSLVPTPGIDRNLFITPGFRPDLLAMMPPNAAAHQGLLTKTRRWIAPQVPGSTATIDTETRYTAAGALAEMKVAGRTRFNITYSPAGRYALPDSITKGAFVSRRSSTTAILRLKWDVGIGELVSLRQPSKGMISFGYDSAMRLVSVRNPRASETERNFSSTGLAYTDTTRTPSGTVLSTSVTEVDGLGLPRRIIETPAGSSPTESLFEYDIRGRLVRFARGHAPGGSPTWFVLQYAAAGRIVGTVMPDGSVSKLDYGRAGAPVNLLATGTSRHEIDPWGRSRYIVTNALGRTVQVLEPPVNGTHWISTAYEYDARSNLLSIYSDASQVGMAVAGRRFQYDGLSRMTQRYLIERSATLDAAGRLTSPGLWSDIYRYNDQSQLTQHVDPRGVVTSYDHRADPLGRLFAIRVTLPPPKAGAPTILPVPDTQFSYMRFGDPTRLRHVQSVGVYEEIYRYDPQSRLDEIITTFADQPSSPVRQRVTRDSAHRVDLFAISTPVETELQLHYQYDSSGRRFQINGTGNPAGGWSITASFEPQGALSQLRYAQAVWEAIETFSVDPVSRRFSRQVLAIAGNPVLDQSYYYDEASRPGHFGLLSRNTSSTDQLVAIKDNAAGFTYYYGYDALARLRLVTSGGRIRQTGYEYAYDAAGNRIAARGMEYRPVAVPTVPPIQPAPGIDLGDAAADGQRELLVDRFTNHIASTGFAYDAAGNMVRLPRKDGTLLLLEYDGLGRLGRVERSGAPDAETYIYNHNNQLIVLRRADGSVRYSVWHGVASATHFEASSVATGMRHTETPVTLGGRVVSRVIGPTASATPEFLHHMPNGAVVTAPANSTPVRSSNLRPYGFDASSTTNVSMTPRYHSYGRSHFGIDYAINRHYDPETGRFLQTDPLGQAVYRAEDPQSLNLYAFTRADPINRRDRLGLDACGCDAGGSQVASPDGGFTCNYFFPKTVYETVVHAHKGDSTAIIKQWMPSYGAADWVSPYWARWQMLNPEDDDQALQDAVNKQLDKRLRQLLEKREKCAAARASFAAAANSYARVGANLAIHNLQVEALQFQAVETGADIMENYFEQREDFSGKQLGAAGAGRGAAAMSILKQYQAAKINKALLEADQRSAVEAMKSAAEARVAACM